MPRDSRDYKLDLSAAPTASEAARARPRPYLSVHFACCGAYQRLYLAADGTSYRGRCPRCGAPVNFKVGEGGTSSRSFVVS